MMNQVFKRTNELIIIPACNEAEYITDVISKTRKHYPHIDILVVNDGSADDTGIIAKNEGAIVINLPFNAGYGIALQTGFKYAYVNNYQYVVSMDADGQHSPSYAGLLLEALKKEEYDLIIGSRFLHDRTFPMPVLKRIGLIIFRQAIKLHTKKIITDPTSGFQAMNRKLLKFYISHYYPVDYPDADLIIMIHRAGFRFKEIAVEMLPNPKKKGMHSGLKPLYYVFKMMISILTILLRKKSVYEQSE